MIVIVCTCTQWNSEWKEQTKERSYILSGWYFFKWLVFVCLFVGIEMKWNDNKRRRRFFHHQFSALKKRMILKTFTLVITDILGQVHRDQSLSLYNFNNYNYKKSLLIEIVIFGGARFLPMNEQKLQQLC